MGDHGAFAGILPSTHIKTMKPSMHWLTLRFADVQAEHAFAEDSLPRLARQGQIAVWMGIVVYLVHGLVLDSVLPLSELQGMWALRMTAMLVPVLVLLLRPTPWFGRYGHWGLSMVGFTAGWGLIAMQLQVPEQYAAAFYPLIVEVAFYTYNFVGARFVYALGVDLTLLVLYNVVFTLLRPYPLNDLLGHDFFLFSANLIGGTAGYLAERQKRLLYLQTQELSRVELAVRESEAEKARIVERSRILQDMHDGVGAHIGAAIRQMQSPTFSHSEVLATLRDSLDQLKMTIDAMHLEPGDITTLLASLRYRMEPRLQSMHLEVHWAMGLLPQLTYLTVDDMRQLQFILLEALSNAMQHSHATVLRIEAELRPATPMGDPPSVCLRLVDNGDGFDSRRPTGNGISAMRERARRIGGQLTLHSAPGATCVEVLLPVH